MYKFGRCLLAGVRGRRPGEGLPLRPPTIYIDREGGETAQEARPGTSIDQDHWVDAALEMFGRVFGGATAYPKARGTWRDDERNGALVKDEPVVVHCYTTPADIEDSGHLAELGRFCRTTGRDARQGEVGLVIGDEYFAIREFT